MKRQSFMEKLRILLGDLPEEEREEAIQYYEDYFEDAGPEMEEEVIRELGSPEKVALMLREGIRGEETGAEYAETGYYETRYDDKRVPAEYTEIKSREKSGEYEGTEKSQKPWTNRNLKMLLIILIICVGASSVIPVIGSIIFGVLGVIAGIFGIFFAFVVGAFCIVIVGVGFISAGIPLMVSATSAGIFVTGAGLILLALGILGAVFSIRLCKVMVPAIFWWIVNSVRRLLFRGKAGA